MNLFFFGFLFLCTNLVSICYSFKTDISVDFQNNLQSLDSLEADFKCKSAGLACDCTNLNFVYFCINQGGVLVPEVIDTCTGGKVCVESSGGCDVGPNPNCNVAPFTMDCTSNGMFPDPFDCRKYYVCVNTSANDAPFQAYPNGCFGEFGYDPLSTYCKLPLNTDFSCPQQPIPNCIKATGPQPMASNPSMYYICVKTPAGNYQPKMFRCPHQETATSQGCSGSVVTTTPGPSTSPTPTPHPTCKKGDRYLPDYDNCLFYYDCTQSMVNPPLKQCPKNSSFNKKFLICQEGFGNCP